MRSEAAIFFARRILGFGKKGEGTARYIRGAILGVALSLIPLVVVMVVADSMIEGITARYIEVGTYHFQARPFFSVDTQELAEKAAILRQVPGVKAAFVELQNPGVAILGAKTAGVELRGVDEAFLDDPETRTYLRVRSGEARLDSANQILLGEALAKNLGAKVGDLVSVATTKAGSSGSRQAGDSQGGPESSFGFSPRVSAFKVRGIVSAGYRELDSLWAFVSLKAGSKLSSPGVTYSIVGIKVRSPYGDLEPQRARLEKALSSGAAPGAASGAASGVAPRSPEDWSVLTWPEIERNIYKSFATTKALLMLVMAVAVAVAAINVSSALVMLVLERRRDIAILKSAGASPAFIRKIFVLSGLAVGACGTALGIGVGTLLSWRINDLISAAEKAVNAVSGVLRGLSGTPAPREVLKLLDPAYYLETVPVSIKPLELGAVALGCLFLCFVASLVPARRAAKLPPLEIFRKT